MSGRIAVSAGQHVRMHEAMVVWAINPAMSVKK